MRSTRLSALGALALLALLAVLGCKSPPPPKVAPPPPPPKPPAVQWPGRPPQPARLLGTIEGTAVLALDAPSLSSLPHDQRMLAWQVAQAAARGEAVAYDQGDRHNLAVVRLLRGILSRPHASSQAVLDAIRSYARALWLFHGLHDPATGHKLRPAFTAANLRSAALAARAAGADLGLLSVEYGLRNLEAVIFDPQVDGRRTARGSDLPASAVNLYQGVQLRDLAAFREEAPLSSRLTKEGAALREVPYVLPAVARGLDAALPFSAPPQRMLLERLAAFFGSGSAEAFRAATAAYLEVRAPVEFSLGFLDLSADPRGRKGLFAGYVGVRDAQRTADLLPVAQAAPDLARLLPVPMASAPPPAAAAVALAASSGALALDPDALTLPPSPEERARMGAKTVFFAAAQDAANELRERAVTALADPAVAGDLGRCLPQQRFAFSALRELVGRSRLPRREPLLDQATLAEVRADLVAHLLAPLPRVRELGLLPDLRCQELWPHFAAAQLALSLLGLEPGERIDGDLERARALQLFWLTAKGGLSVRHDEDLRVPAPADPTKLHAAEAELLGLLQQIETHGDSARLADLLERHASRAEPWIAEATARLRKAGIPPRVVLLPPRIEAVLQGGRAVDARAVPIGDLDAAVLHDWSQL
jgi:dipeptidyl-peptidase-3